jgi:molybdopterin converting factor small subunit
MSGGDMQINVKLFATFRVGRFSEQKREYPSGTCVSGVIEDLQIPEAQVGILMLHNRHVSPDQELTDGVDLAIFPFVGGGS